ncbi:MAG: 30S ribosomal protein S12 methylthiotransferase RimO [Candidatus Cloacimonetes bacterium]|nr:30S ribosomal protein S12 methylthiotransferase RimO [Candidatus Cloacimonadota bacterium]
MKTYYIESLGCPKNLVDSEIFAKLTEDNGYMAVDKPEEAELIIVNTCGFILDAKEEAIDTIMEMNLYRESGKLKKLIATGCFIGRYFDELREELTEVDHLINLKDFRSFNKIFTDGEPELKRKLLTPTHYAYLRISDGCDNLCTYCAIPLIRGKLISEPLEKVIEEAEYLAKEGVKELIVTAQDVTQYGIDLYDERKLPELLKKLEAIEGFQWIRLLYMHPAHITDELIRVIAESSKVLPYFDIPLQHSASSILKVMNRKITASAQRDVLLKIKKAIPDAVIRTTFISGFPGETDSDHQQLLAFIQEMKFGRLGVFTYSPEESTPAAKLKGKVPTKTAIARKDEIMMIQQAISEEFMASFIGKEIPVIIDKESEEDGILYEGRTKYDAPEIDGAVFIVSGNAEVGEIVTVRIIDSWEYDLVGEIVYLR